MQPPSGGCLARRSHTAVLRGAALAGLVPTDELSTVLYRAGGVAVGPGARDRWWIHHLAKQAADRAGVTDAAYTWQPGEHWNSWTAVDADPVRLVHKIYLSPVVSDLPRALPLAFDLAVGLGVPAWKMGATPEGLHRPDKIVLYLADPARADDVALSLSDALASVTAQGVPFSGQVGPTGIVSRGLDMDGTSWRAVICSTLADALTGARSALGAEAPADEVADHALRRLSTLGLDVHGWQPARPVGAAA